MKNKLQIGWAEESLVPEKKVSLAGQFFERISQYVESEITVTAMALECGGDSVILASVDIEGLHEGILSAARQRLGSLIPDFDAEKLIIAATHSHTSLKLSGHEPAKSKKGDGVTVMAAVLEEFLPENMNYDTQVVLDDTVMTAEEGTAFVTEKIALAAARAWQAKADAYIASEFARAAVGMCRRAHYLDGRSEMWGDTNTGDFDALEGGNDSGIELLYTFDAKKKRTGIVANIACPAQILEQRSFISADYWGRAKANLRAKFGGNLYLLGLCGAAGDQCPRDLIRWVQPETPIDDPNVRRPHPLPRRADPSMYDISGCNRVGRRISDEIAAVYEEITEMHDTAVFAHRVVHDSLPLRKVTKSEYDHAVREIEYYVEKNRHKAAFDFEDNAKMHVHAGLIARYREQQFTATVPVEYHVIRLGDIAITTNPFEMYLDYGNRLKARSPAQQTFVVQLSCGALGYLPTAKAEAAGHYSAYVSSGRVGHEGGDILIRRTLTEIQSLWELSE